VSKDKWRIAMDFGELAKVGSSRKNELNSQSNRFLLKNKYL
jgi:hypothetical protein